MTVHNNGTFRGQLRLFEAKVRMLKSALTARFDIGYNSTNIKVYTGATHPMYSSKDAEHVLKTREAVGTSILKRVSVAMHGSKGVPARPFLLAFRLASKEDIKTLAKKFVKYTISYDSRPLIRNMFLGDMLAFVLSDKNISQFAPLSAETLRIKGHSQQLIDTGEMLLNLRPLGVENTPEVNPAYIAEVNRIKAIARQSNEKRH